MAKIGIFIDRKSFNTSLEIEALMRFRKAVEGLGNEGYFFLRNELHRLREFDAIFIRAFTDPLNTTYIVSRLAEMYGIPVIDDSHSIRICCDKVNMYSRLSKAKVAIPKTIFLNQKDLNATKAEEIFAQLGNPVVLKAPNSSFSRHIEKAATVEEFLRKARRLFYRAYTIVIQEFIPSSFDWRVGVLGGKPLYICKYTIPANAFTIHAMVEGHQIYGEAQALPIAEASPEVIQAGVAAANAIGDGLYGVDLKEVNGKIYTIEVNDNPTIEAGEEDKYASDLYTKIATYLLAKNATQKSAT